MHSYEVIAAWHKRERARIAADCNPTNMVLGAVFQQAEGDYRQLIRRWAESTQPSFDA